MFEVQDRLHLVQTLLKAFSDVDTGDKVKAYVVNGVALDISSDDSNGALPTVAGLLPVSAVTPSLAIRLS